MKNNTCRNSNGDAFWDREKELEALRAWRGGTPRLAVIHGRRRLGKTSLLRRWLRDDRGCYVQATEGTPASQRAALAEDLQQVLPGFAAAVYPSWRSLFDTLKRQWPAERPVLVLDEFPYLAQSAPELPSILQSMVDARDARRVPLVLCGSSQRMMQGLALDASAPLYGRAQLVLRLQPLPPQDIRRALALPGGVQAVEAYAAFGGVPRYWELMREGGFATVMEAIEGLVLSPNGVLHEEADRVLLDEDAARLERALCELIGRGVRRPSELAGRVGAKETTLAKPLRHLTDLGLVERQTPYDFDTGRPETGGRRAFYRLADPFLAMWYACVRPHLSGLNLEARTSRRHAQEAWTHHVAVVWEDLCRRQWHRLNDQDIEWEPAGRFWETREPTGGEWDVVSVSSDRKHVLLGEAKWMSDPTVARVEAVIRAIKHRPVPLLKRQPKVHLVLFVPNGRNLPPEVDGVALVDSGRVMQV